MQGADTTLQVKEEVDWNDLDQDVVVATPPFYNVDNQSERSCKDIQGEQGAQQPRTPEMLLDLRDVGGAEEGQTTAAAYVENRWPSSQASMAVFLNMSTEDFKKERECL